MLNSLVREDILYIDQIQAHYSTKRHEGYTNFSDNFRKRFPGYHVVDHCVAPLTEKTLNFKRQIAVLKSTDASLCEEWMF